MPLVDLHVHGMMDVPRLETVMVTHAHLAQINRLLQQLTNRDIRLEFDDLVRIISRRENSTFLAMDEDRIVGLAMLVWITTLSDRSGRIEDVVVDTDYRGKRIGKTLVGKLLDRARKYKFHHVELTSRPSRTEANAMYRSMGFELRETNVYRMVLEPKVSPSRRTTLDLGDLEDGFGCHLVPSSCGHRPVGGGSGCG